LAGQPRPTTTITIIRPSGDDVSADSTIRLELDDIQAAVLYPRPSPYVGTLILARVDDRRDGRELLRRLIPALVTAAPSSQDPRREAWAAVALTFQGLKALGVPPHNLATFPEAFRSGMAARADLLGDTGLNAPERWEPPLGRPEVHIAIYALAPDASRLNAVLQTARAALRDLPGVPPIWQQDTYQRPDERTAFGFRDGIAQPGIEGSGIPGSNPHEEPLKAGEFVLGYPNESGNLTPMPEPEALRRNGSYIAFRKLYAREAAFRQYLRARAKSRAEEELLAAKFVGRWPSGAPLVFAPEHDDPELGADPKRNDAFLYVAADDARGIKCPLGAHARRMNARDAPIVGVVRRHRMIRRSTSYGPELPDGVLEDDGADRGILFTCIVADLDRQFEFVQTQWINDGMFIGTPEEQDPLVGPHVEPGDHFTVPQVPIRRRLTGLPQFVVNRGGEYCFMPGLRALRWITELKT
jgi:Dyp-type peroxidase family